MPNWHCTDLYGKDLHEEEGLPQVISFFTCNKKHPASLQRLAGCFLFLFLLFPLNRCRRFARDVIDDTVDARHFIDDAAGDDIKDMVGDMGPVTCHAVGAVDGAQSDGVVVGALVAHDADTAHVGQRGKVLARALGHGQLVDLLTPDGVGILHDGDLLRGHIADDADGQARAGERLTADQIFGQAQLTASLTDFVLEQVDAEARRFP